MAPICDWVTKLHATDRRLCFGFELDAATAASGLFALLVQPDWVKARWRAAVLQNAKLYCRAWAGVC